jgi:hypothetical protein
MLWPPAPLIALLSRLPQIALNYSCIDGMFPYDNITDDQVTDWRFLYAGFNIHPFLRPDVDPEF